MIAALYVATNGVYYGLHDVDPWDEQRDARLYAGPYPVVAHPPCQRWGKYWGGSPTQWPRLKKGDDGGCFRAALDAVRAWGGVLEHPEGSADLRAVAQNGAAPCWRVLTLSSERGESMNKVPVCSNPSCPLHNKTADEYATCYEFYNHGDFSRLPAKKEIYDNPGVFLDYPPTGIVVSVPLLRLYTVVNGEVVSSRLCSDCSTDIDLEEI